MGANPVLDEGLQLMYTQDNLVRISFRGNERAVVVNFIAFATAYIEEIRERRGSCSDSKWQRHKCRFMMAACFGIEAVSCTRDRHFREQ